MVVLSASTIHTLSCYGVFTSVTFSVGAWCNITKFFRLNGQICLSQCGACFFKKLLLVDVKRGMRIGTYFEKLFKII